MPDGALRVDDDVETLLAALVERGIQIWLAGDELRYRAPQGSTREWLAEIRPRKQEIVAFLRRRGAANGDGLDAGERPDIVPIAPAQEGLWFLARLGMLGSAYTVSSVVRMRGALDSDALERALREIVRRHESLRTRFATVDGQGVQIVDSPDRFACEHVDLTSLDPAARSERAESIVASHVDYEFDLEHEAPFRVTLVRLAPDEHMLALAMPHLVMDAWSNGILERELSALYAAYSAGLPSALPEPVAQYADYALWQRRRLGGSAAAEHLAYWKARLAGMPDALDLPADRPRPATPSFRGGTVTFPIAAASAAGVTALARSADMTPFMVLLAAFQVFLSRLSGQRDVAVGTLVAGRDHAQTEDLIGYFLNTLVVRADLSGKPSFHDALDLVKRAVLEAYEHQETPFDQLVAELSPVRELGRQPLFQVAFVHRNQTQKAFALRGLAADIASPASATAKFDLTLTVTENPAGWEGEFEYAADLFDRETVERFANWFGTLVSAAVVDPGARLSALPLLTERERSAVLALAAPRRPLALGPPDAGASAFKTLAEPFERQVSRTPDAVALEGAEGTLTYRALNARANRLARHLRRRGVRPGEFVGVCAERGFAMIVALYAIAKAGAAYLPLEPDLPPERIAFMLDDARVRLVLSHAGAADALGSERSVVLVDDEALFAAEPDGDLDLPGSPNRTGYLLYTSGSTGRPKGVAYPVEACVAFLFSIQERYRLGADDTVLLKTSYGFDLSVGELFWPLYAGARVAIAPPGEHRDPRRLARTLERHEVTVVHFVPSMLAALLADAPEGPGRSLRLVICAGEALTPALRDAFHARSSAQLVNLYGPTETNAVTAYEVPRDSAPSVPLGTALAAFRLYVLDEELEPVPVGVAGELYIGGRPGLAHGYQGRPALTAERFGPDPFSSEPGARLYRTGDVCRYRRDGLLEYLGRNDHQVKIRGFRIELGEVEAALRACAGVKSAVVLAHAAPGGGSVLSAYAVPTRGDLDVKALRDELKRTLPPYMVPGSIRVLDALPLTSNGKLDRAALLALEPAAVGEDHVEPRTPIEQALAAIWNEVLGPRPVGAQSSFFDLGGHSLAAVRVQSRIIEQFRIDFSLKAVYEAASLGELAERVAGALRARSVRGAGADGDAFGQTPRPDPLPLSLAQEGLWFLGQLGLLGSTYTVSRALRLRGPLDRAALERALREVVRRHESLRTRIGTVGGQGVQVVDPPDAFAPEWIDLSALDSGLRAARAEALAAERAERAFEFARDALFAVTVLRLTPDEHVLVLAMHHVIADGWSLGVLERELSVLYAAYRDGAASPLPEPAAQYADYALWQRRTLPGEALERQLAYWKERLAGIPDALELPADRPRPATPTFRGGSVTFALSASAAAGVRALAGRERTTPFVVLLAAFQALLGRLSNQRDVVVGSPVSGRTHRATEELIGYFVNTLVLRADLAGNPTFRALVGQVKQSVFDAYEHQDVPFDKLVAALQPVRELGRQPLFQVGFTFQSGGAAEFGLPGLAVEPLGALSDTAKFDLTLFVNETEGGFEAGLEYAADLFDRATAERFAAHFQVLLSAALENPAAPLSALPLIDAAERARLIGAANAAAPEYGRGRCLHESFACQAARAPNAVALSFEDERLTYGELDAKANQLAHYLRERGVRAQSIVGLRLERSLDAVVAILGVLKAGAAYLPLDPQYPPERAAFMLADAGAVLLLAHSSLPDIEATGVPTIELDRAWPQIGRSPSDAPAVPVGPDALAYVIYTSGSSGQPKGVMVTHHNVGRLFEATRDAFAFAASDVWALCHSLAFDFSVWEIFGALLHGARLAIPPLLTVQSPEQLHGFLGRQGVTVLNQTPSAFEQLVRAVERGGPSTLDALRLVVFGGEALDVAALAPWFERYGDERPVLTNMYGITETTVHVTRRRIRRADLADPRSPIGAPLADLQLYVLDDALEPAPVGVAGELYVGGAGLARGYLGRPALTAERYVPNPFARRAGERLYKTGDLALIRPDGDVAYLGRNDQQVKVRGFRIELGEIEAALRARPQVASAVVLALPAAGGRQLRAYVVPAQDGLDVQALRQDLKRSLPGYMVPASIAVLEALPLTANGKLDRNALAALAATAPRADVHVPPRTPVEQALAEIWNEVLGPVRAGASDNFFELGGHSLAAVRVQYRIAELFEIDLSLKAVYETATLAELAQLIVARMFDDDPLSMEDAVAALNTER